MAEDRTVDKLIEVVSRQSELLPGQHSADATELKKEWFNYVLITLEKAQTAIDKLTADQHIAAKDLLERLIKIKDDLRLEILDLRSIYDSSLDKLEKRIEKMLDDLSRKVEAISMPSVKQELRLEISKLRTELLQIISATKDSLRKEDLDPLKKNVTTLTVKVGFIGVLGGLAGSGLLMLVMTIVKHWLESTP